MWEIFLITVTHRPGASAGPGQPWPYRAVRPVRVPDWLARAWLSPTRTRSFQGPTGPGARASARRGGLAATTRRRFAGCRALLPRNRRRGAGSGPQAIGSAGVGGPSRSSRLPVARAWLSPAQDTEWQVQGDRNFKSLLQRASDLPRCWALVAPRPGTSDLRTLLETFGLWGIPKISDKVLRYKWIIGDIWRNWRYSKSKSDI